MRIFSASLKILNFVKLRFEGCAVTQMPYAKITAFRFIELKSRGNKSDKYKLNITGERQDPCGSPYLSSFLSGDLSTSTEIVIAAFAPGDFTYMLCILGGQNDAYLMKYH